MNRYTKGARGERELLNRFYKMGYSVVRSAGSGVNSLSPDILAIKNGRGYAFECKAWDNNRLSIEADKYDTLVEWERNTLMRTYMAWRMSNNGWFFIEMHEMSRSDKSYGVTKRRALEINRRLEGIIPGEDLALLLEKKTLQEENAEIVQSQL